MLELRHMFLSVTDRQTDFQSQILRAFGSKNKIPCGESSQIDGLEAGKITYEDSSLNV